MSDNQGMDRPVSPHLSIYKPQITSVLSISHRASGFALYFGALALAWLIVVSVYGCGPCLGGILSSTVGKVAIALWSMAAYYHMLNGIRHLVWDSGRGYEISSVTRSGVLVVLGALGLTLYTWFYAIDI